MNKRTDALYKEALQLKNDMISWRRHFHSNPETGLDVPETALYIRNFLKARSIEILEGTPGHTVIGKLKGLSSRAPMGLRADMDALEIPEKTELSFASRKENRMHACGHDGHMAMLMGAAELLKKREETLPQDTYLIFQPGEEDPGGAEPIMESGVLDSLKGIFAIHLDPQQPCGQAGINPDRAMASTDSFHIVLTGKGGHAALPHQSVDPIAIAAQVVNSLQFIVSRLIDPVQPAVLTLGSIQGGYRPNVIPDSVSLSGTIRTFSEEIRLQIQREIEKTLSMYCSRYNASYSFDLVPGYPPVINDKRMSHFILDLAGLFGDALTMEQMPQPRMAGEDFSYYLETIPGAFYWLGCRNEEKNCVYPLHHSCFNMDEDALPLGAALHAASALEFSCASGSDVKE
ncbi:MAG: amidohydrolase [Spirochaetales bacterium]|nr:amidohydrolase [Spirochaetales bacterium]